MRSLCVLTVFFSLACSPVMAQAATESPVRVVTTLFPLYDFCRQVGGDAVDCKMLLAPGVEPHAFSPSPQDMLTINDADLFIYTSDVMEPWLDGYRKNVSSTVRVVAAGEGLATLSTSGHAACDHGCTGHHDHSAEEGPMDPHVWLDFDKAKAMVDIIRDALIAVRPTLKIDFESRAEAYKKTLSQLDDRIRKELAACELKTIISGGHFAFGYFVKRYGLNHVSPYQGFAPDAEPSPAAIADLIDALKAQRQTTIFTEEMLNDRVAKIISSKTGARISLLHAAHNLTPDEFKRGETFVSIMEGNLERLTAALKLPGEPSKESQVGGKPPRTVGIIIFVAIAGAAILAISLIVFPRKRS